MHSPKDSRRKFFSIWLRLGPELYGYVQLHDDHVVGGSDHAVQYQEPLKDSMYCFSIRRYRMTDDRSQHDPKYGR